MRRILRKIAEGEADKLGDTSTLADPSIVDVSNCKFCDILTFRGILKMVRMCFLVSGGGSLGQFCEEAKHRHPLPRSASR